MKALPVFKRQSVCVSKASERRKRYRITCTHKIKTNFVKLPIHGHLAHIARFPIFQFPMEQKCTKKVQGLMSIWLYSCYREWAWYWKGVCFGVSRKRNEHSYHITGTGRLYFCRTWDRYYMYRELPVYSYVNVWWLVYYFTNSVDCLHYWRQIVFSDPPPLLLFYLILPAIKPHFLV